MTDDLLRVDSIALKNRSLELTRGLDNRGLWFARWFSEIFVFALLVFYGIPLLFDWRPIQTSDVTSRAGMFRLAMSLVMAAVGTAHRYRNARKLQTDPPTIAEAAANKNWLYLVGPGWKSRTIKGGLFITLGVGVPVGLLMAFGSPVAELPDGSRAEMLIGFIGMTALWAMPMAFVLRWSMLRKQRPLMRASEGASA